MLAVRAFFDLYEAGVQLGILPARGERLGERALLMLAGFGLRGRAPAPPTSIVPLCRAPWIEHR